MSDTSDFLPFSSSTLTIGPVTETRNTIASIRLRCPWTFTCQTWIPKFGRDFVTLTAGNWLSNPNPLTCDWSYSSWTIVKIKDERYRSREIEKFIRNTKFTTILQILEKIYSKQHNHFNDNEKLSIIKIDIGSSEEKLSFRYIRRY